MTAAITVIGYPVPATDGAALMFITSEAGDCTVITLLFTGPVDFTAFELKSVPEALPLNVIVPVPAALYVHEYTPEEPALISLQPGACPSIYTAPPVPVCIMAVGVTPRAAAPPVFVTTMKTRNSWPMVTKDGP